MRGRSPPWRQRLFSLVKGLIETPEKSGAESRGQRTAGDFPYSGDGGQAEPAQLKNNFIRKPERLDRQVSKRGNGTLSVNNGPVAVACQCPCDAPCIGDCSL